MDSPLGWTIVSQLTYANLTYALPSERWRRSQRSVAKTARGAFGSGASFGRSDCQDHGGPSCPQACADRAAPVRRSGPSRVFSLERLAFACITRALHEPEYARRCIELFYVIHFLPSS